MLKTALFDCAINEKCCSVDGGRGICPLFSSPPRGIWQLKSRHSREFTIQGKKKCGGNLVNNNFTLFCIARRLQEFSKDWSTGASRQSFIREAAPRGPAPYPFIFHFWHKRYPFHTPCLELCIPLNYCTCTVFKIWINHKTRPFTQLFSQPCKASVVLFGIFYQPKWQFSLPLHILQQVKSHPSHTLKAWKWYPFRVEPLPKGHFREYPRGFKSALSFDQQYVQWGSLFFWHYTL